MYFYTQTDKKDQTSFTKLASFFIEKFPLAFGGKAVYFNADGASSEDQFMRQNQATKIEYHFEEPQHAQTFAKF